MLQLEIYFYLILKSQNLELKKLENRNLQVLQTFVTRYLLLLNSIIIIDKSYNCNVLTTYG